MSDSALEAAARRVAETTEALQYQLGEDGPVRVAAWLVTAADMDSLRAALGCPEVAPRSAGVRRVW